MVKKRYLTGIEKYKYSITITHKYKTHSKKMFFLKKILHEIPID